jgi:hypothetical protein
MRKLLICILVLLCTSNALEAQQPRLKKIFNGKNLDGWIAPANNTWWTAGKGILHVKSGPDKKRKYPLDRKEIPQFYIKYRISDGRGGGRFGYFSPFRKRPDPDRHFGFLKT